VKVKGTGLSGQINLEAASYETLADKGEYSIKFLILIALDDLLVGICRIRI
jgi:hypothetical protein